MNRVLFLGNPRAGRCIATDLVREARRNLIGFELETLIPKNHQSLLSKLSALKPGDYHAIILAGGDGTLNTALPFLLGKDIPLYPFPVGTANDLATHLGTKACFVHLQNSLARGQKRKIDLVRVNHASYFATVGGIGVGAKLTEKVNERRKSALFSQAMRLLREQIYSYMSARTILLNKSYLHKVRIQAEEFSEDLSTGVLMVCNQPVLGGDLKVAPNAKVDDGKLDVFVIWATGRKALLQSLLDLKRGEPPPNAYQFQTRKLSVEDLDGKSMQVFGDGESLLFSPRLTFEVLPAVLPVIVEGTP